MSAKNYRSRKEDIEIRTKAVECAAMVLGLRQDLTMVPFAWSLSVFFETYIDGGPDATKKAFGPRKPVKIKAVKSGKR